MGAKLLPALFTKQLKIEHTLDIIAHAVGPDADELCAEIEPVKDNTCGNSHLFFPY